MVGTLRTILLDNILTSSPLQCSAISQTYRCPLVRTQVHHLLAPSHLRCSLSHRTLPKHLSPPNGMMTQARRPTTVSSPAQISVGISVSAEQIYAGISSIPGVSVLVSALITTIIADRIMRVPPHDSVQTLNFCHLQ